MDNKIHEKENNNNSVIIVQKRRCNKFTHLIFHHFLDVSCFLPHAHLHKHVSKKCSQQLIHTVVFKLKLFCRFIYFTADMSWEDYCHSIYLSNPNFPLLIIFSMQAFHLLLPKSSKRTRIEFHSGKFPESYMDNNPLGRRIYEVNPFADFPHGVGCFLQIVHH